MNAELVRFATLETCIIGKLSIGDNYFVTLELPWNNNERRKSCIPAGVYVCHRVCSKKFGDTFEISGVFDRSNILFHPGNTAKDTKGCVLIGELFDLKNESLVNSKKAFGNFMNELESYNDFILKVR